MKNIQKTSTISTQKDVIGIEGQPYLKPYYPHGGRSNLPSMSTISLKEIIYYKVILIRCIK